MMTTAGQRLLDLAANAFSSLSAAGGGKLAYCGNSRATDNDPKKSDNWDAARTIRAPLIRWLCVNREAVSWIDPRGISVEAAKIKGTLDLESATIPFPLRLQRCAIGDGMNLAGADIRRLDFSKSFITSLNGQGLVVHGNVVLREGFRLEGTVQLDGAAISGNLDCDGGSLINPGGTALNGDGIHVAGDVYLRAGFHAEGAVRLIRATITGNLECDGGTFHHQDKTAVYLDSASISGSLFLRDGFQADGEVSLLRATIAGSLDCHGGRFYRPGGDALSVDRTSVSGGVFLHDGFQAVGVIRLVSANVGLLVDDRTCWPLSGNLRLDALTYTSIAGLSTEAKARLDWLQCQAAQPFSPQPYQQLAKVLRENGDEAGAKAVLISKEKARRKYGRLGWKARCWSWVLGTTIGHGYKPYFALLWALAFVLLGWGLFAAGARAGLMVPTKAEVYSHYKQNGRVPPFYPPFRPLLYSLDTLLPIINFGQKDHWRPRDGISATPVPPQWALVAFEPAAYAIPNPPTARGEAHGIWWAGAVARDAWSMIITRLTDGETLRLYRLFHIGVGWLLTTLGVAGFTGLIRKE
jgi:hypothetical protein